MFDNMTDEIKEDTVRGVLSVVPAAAPGERRQVATVTGIGANSKSRASREPIKKGAKVGRNDPCPCGSGKKYKKCCGANSND